MERARLSVSLPPHGLSPSAVCVTARADLEQAVSPSAQVPDYRRILRTPRPGPGCAWASPMSLTQCWLPLVQKTLVVSGFSQELASSANPRGLELSVKELSQRNRKARLRRHHRCHQGRGSQQLAGYCQGAELPGHSHSARRQMGTAIG